MVHCGWDEKDRKEQEKGISEWDKENLEIMDMFISLIVVIVSWVYKFVQIIIYFKYVQFIICHLCLSKDVKKYIGEKTKLTEIYLFVSIYLFLD